MIVVLDINLFPVPLLVMYSNGTLCSATMFFKV